MLMYSFAWDDGFHELFILDRKPNLNSQVCIALWWLGDPPCKNVAVPELRGGESPSARGSKGVQLITTASPSLTRCDKASSSSQEKASFKH